MPKTVADAMSRDPIVVRPETLESKFTASDAAVVDDAGQLVGII